MFGSNCLKDLGTVFFVPFSPSAFRLWTPWIRERSPKRPRPRDVRAGSCQTLQLDWGVFSEVTTPKDRMVGGMVGGVCWLHEVNRESCWVLGPFWGERGCFSVLWLKVIECAYGEETRGVWFRAPVDAPIGQWLVLYETLSAAGCWFLRCYLLFIYLDWRL